MGTRFQALFHSPRRGAFHLSLTVLFAIGRWGYLALDVVGPASHGFHVSRGTRGTSHRAGTPVRLRGSHPLWPAVPGRSATPPLRLGPPARGPTLAATTPAPHRPAGHSAAGLGCARFARRYSGHPLLLPPRGTEMFQFPRFPPLLWIQAAVTGLTRAGLPHSGTVGSSPARRLPRGFSAAPPRPSSAPGARASPGRTL